jgi:hypothetical protein
MFIFNHKGHLTPVRMAIITNTTNAGEDAAKKEPSASYTAGGNVN